MLFRFTLLLLFNLSNSFILTNNYRIPLNKIENRASN